MSVFFFSVPDFVFPSSMGIRTSGLGFHVRDSEFEVCGLGFRVCSLLFAYRGASLIRKRFPTGPYNRHMPRILWWSWEGRFLMSEVPLYFCGTHLSTFGVKAISQPPTIEQGFGFRVSSDRSSPRRRVLDGYWRVQRNELGTACTNKESRFGPKGRSSPRFHLLDLYRRVQTHVLCTSYSGLSLIINRLPQGPCSSICRGPYGGPRGVGGPL